MPNYTEAREAVPAPNPLPHRAETAPAHELGPQGQGIHEHSRAIATPLCSVHRRRLSRRVHMAGTVAPLEDMSRPMEAPRAREESTAAALILAHAAGRRRIVHAGSTPSRGAHPSRRTRHEKCRRCPHPAPIRLPGFPRGRARPPTCCPRDGFENAGHRARTSRSAGSPRRGAPRGSPAQALQQRGGAQPQQGPPTKCDPPPFFILPINAHSSSA